MENQKLSQRTETVESTDGFLHIIRDVGSGLSSFKIAIANLLKTTAPMVFGGQAVPKSATITFSATASFNLNSGNSQQMTLTSSLTSLAVTNKQNGGSYLIYLIQDATGGRTIPTPDVSLGSKTDNSSNFSTDINAVNIININVRPDGTTYYTVETYIP